MDLELASILIKHDSPITKLNFSPDSNQIISSSLGPNLLLWDLNNLSRAQRLLGHKNAINDVTFSNSGNLIASASSDTSVRLWSKCNNNTNFFESSSLNCHTNIVKSVCFSPDDTQLISASIDKINIWSIPQKKFVGSLSIHTDWINCAIFSPNGNIIASCSDDGTIKLIDSNERECFYSYTSSEGIPVSIIFDPSNNYLVFGTKEANLSMLDLRKKEILQSHDLNRNYGSYNPINSIAYDPNQQCHIAIGLESEVMIMDLSKGCLLNSITNVKGSVNSVAFSQNGEYFAFGGTEKCVNISKIKN